ncbi:MAG TPA: hypothetical protein VMS17_06305 [Gemmataceae bacterium]|nr:hypothetical protein [Gemmataceae bacterium]
MKYHGYYWSYGYKDPDGQVTQAALTKSTLSLVWEEDGDKGQLDAKVTEEDLFEGQFSYMHSPGVGQFLFRLYRSGSRVLLFGTWYWPPQQEEGAWVIVLDPVEEQHDKR